MIFAWSADITHDRRPWAADLLFPAILIYVGAAVIRNDLPAGADLPADTFLQAVLAYLPVLFVIYLMNALFLFGRAVCSKVGSIHYLLIVAAVTASAAALARHCGRDTLWTAACAVNAIVGMYLMFWPTHTIDCIVLFRHIFDRLEFSGFWVIAAWALIDLAFGVIAGWTDALIAHLAFFAAGLAAAYLLIKARLVKSGKHDWTLIQVFTKEEGPDTTYDPPYTTPPKQDPEEP